jgi:hypothetical protein
MDKEEGSSRSGRPRVRAEGNVDAGARLERLMKDAGLTQAALGRQMKDAEPGRATADPARNLRDIFAGRTGPTPAEAARLSQIFQIAGLRDWWEWPPQRSPIEPVPPPVPFWRRRHLQVTAGVALLALGLVLLQGSGADQPTPGRTSGPAPSGTNGTGAAEAPYSYFDKATAPNQDIDLDVGYGGRVGQTFTATAKQIASVAVIVSRDEAVSPGFQPGEIGHVRLDLRPVSGDGQLGEPLGIGRFMAGPNHRDTVMQFDPVPTTPGQRYAFVVTNDEPGVVLAFSLRPRGAGGAVSFWAGTTKSPDAPMPPGRDNRAIAGYVCTVPGGC